MSLEDEFHTWMKAMARGFTIPVGAATSLLKAKNLEPILKYLIMHYRPPLEHQAISLNLKHAQIRKRMVATAEGNAKRHITIVSEVEDARLALEQEMKELHRIDGEEMDLMKKEKEILTQISILNLVKEKTEKEIKQLESWKLQLGSLFTKNLAQIGTFEDHLPSPLLKEELQAVLGKVKAIRQNILNKSYNNFHNDKVAVWQLVEDLMERHQPEAVVKTLQLIAEREIDDVCRHTSQVNIARDAEALRFKYESSGKFIDECSESVLQSVNTLLVLMNAKHIKLHFKIVKTKQEAQLIEDSLDAVKKNIEKELGKRDLEKLKATMAPSCLEWFANWLLSEKMRSVTFHASYDGFEAATARVDQLHRDAVLREMTARKARRDVVEKFEKIIHFDSKVLFLVMERLMKANGSQEINHVQPWFQRSFKKSVVDNLKNLSLSIASGRGLLENEFSAIQSIVKEKCDQFDLPTHTEHSLNKELDTFLSLPLEVISAGGYFDLLGISAWEEDLRQPSTSWEHLADTVRRKKLQLRLTSSEAEFQRSLLKGMEDLLEGRSDLTLDEVKDLCKKAKSSDKLLEQNVGKALESCGDLHSKTEEKLKSVEMAISDWWDQPVKNIANF